MKFDILMYIPRALYLARIATKAVCRSHFLNDVLCWKVNQVIVVDINHTLVDNEKEIQVQEM